MRVHRAYVFQHIECEDLGTFAAPLAGRGLHIAYVRLFAGESIPRDCEDARALIVLGGPMSVNDEAEHAYLAAEKAVIRRALERAQPVFGVCLGAQLLAAAAGARVFPGTRPEIGWGPIELTEPGRGDPVLGCVGTLAAVFHWHGETFDLPRGAQRLAASAVTANQAFRLGASAYGLQFHLEVDAAMIEAWVRAYPGDLGADREASARLIAADTARYIGALRIAATAAIEAFVDASC